MMKIDSKTMLYGLVGYPVGHSLGPIMHNAAFSETGINAVYLAFGTQDIQGCLNGMKAIGIKGLSVTIPHKTAVIPLLDEVDQLAEKIGAVNTVVNKNDRLIGYNTDAIGAYRALEEEIDPKGKRYIIIGAGGAARAIGFILKENGLDLSLANRSVERGKVLAHDLGCPFIPLSMLEETSPDVLIHTTSVGMAPDSDQCVVSEQVLKQGMVVMDIVYNPLETKLLAMAKAKGCLTINGLGMFIHQGVEQFKLWTGLEAPKDIMLDAIKQALES